MANTFMVEVGEEFDLATFGESLKSMWQAKGFDVVIAKMGKSISLQFDKGCGGVNMLLGLGQGITATCMLQGNNLAVNYSDGDWTGKIVGLVVGWFLCLVPFITAIIGAVKQSSLPKEINKSIMMLINQ